MVYTPNFKPPEPQNPEKPIAARVLSIRAILADHADVDAFDVVPVYVNASDVRLTVWGFGGV